uniref:Programmed cell death protein 2-like n=1 Tax=Rhizophora mucronata TaxID=61149 RepID=A0A2P2QQB2_RHIMU
MQTGLLCQPSAEFSYPPFQYLLTLTFFLMTHLQNTLQRTANGTASTRRQKREPTHIGLWLPLFLTVVDHEKYPKSMDSCREFSFCTITASSPTNHPPQVEFSWSNDFEQLLEQV